jgi:integrase
MGSIQRKQTTRPMPKGAELFEKNGSTFARWRARGRVRMAEATPDGRRVRTWSATWWAKFKDADGVVVERSTECRDEQAAKQVLAKWEREVEQIRAGTLTVKSLAAAKRSREPIETHFAAFKRLQQAKQVSAVYLKNSMAALRRVAADCRFTTLADLDADPFVAWLTDRTADGMAARTRNGFREAWIIFANWCVETDRLPENPFMSLPRANVKADRRKKRRALTEGELDRLLSVARTRALDARLRKTQSDGEAKLSPEYRAKLERDGRDRALIYKTYLLTGLRFSELRSLTVGQVRFDNPPRIELNAADEKNRKGSVIPLRPDLANELRAYLDGRGYSARSSDRLLPVPLHLVRHLTADLKAAGIPKVDEQGCVVDVHGLRHTFNTLLAKGGVHQRVAQELMRHSDPRLTANVYTHLRVSDTAGALDALPSLSLDGSPAGLVAPTVAPATVETGRNESIPVVEDVPVDDEGEAFDLLKMTGIVNENGPESTWVNSGPVDRENRGKVAAIGFEPMTSRL